MSTQDILIYESGNGGEMAVLNNDIALCEQLLQQAYLCLFGGNIEASTKGDELSGQVRNDWWGNNLLFLDNKPKQFNSETERALLENPVTSNGRIKIIRAVENDLKYFKTIADIKVDASIASSSKVQIVVSLSRPGSNRVTTMQLVWDNAKQELLIEKNI